MKKHKKKKHLFVHLSNEWKAGYRQGYDIGYETAANKILYAKTKKKKLRDMA